MKKREIPSFVTYILIVVAVISCIFGIYRDETQTVLNKAINICMECIGLG